jgi:hypothetical protein
MDSKELDRLLHELVSVQQTFKSYEQLANGYFRFSPQQFRKCVVKLQVFIDEARDLVKEEKDFVQTKM